MNADTKTVDVLAVVKRLAKEAELALLDGAGIEEGEAVPQDIAEKIVGIWKACDSTSAAIAKAIECMRSSPCFCVDADDDGDAVTCDRCAALRAVSREVRHD